MSGSHKDPNKMTFYEHLTELRSRILKSIAVVLLLTIISLFYADKMRFFLTRPVGSAVYLSPPEAFITNLKLGLLSGVVLSSPYIFYQCWLFVLPALKIREKRYALLLSAASALLFVSGVLFAHYVLIPVSIRFFLGFSDEQLFPMFSISRYIAMVIGMTLASGLVFELPLAILFLAKIGIIAWEDLKKRRGYAIVAIFIIAALLSPPDVFSQLLLVIPLMALYEFSILLARVFCR
jgi:sec-independent protein translocase protein TatC